MTRAEYAREIALLLLLALLWGSSYLFVKIAVAEIPPLTLIAVRVTVATTFLLTVICLRGERLPMDPGLWARFLVQAFLTSIGAWTILAWGQQHVSAGLASVLNSTSPIFVFLITVAITRHEATGWLRLFGACLGLAGVVLIVGVEALSGLGVQVAGQLAALAGAFLYACGAIHGRRFGHLSAPVTAAGAMICATLVLVPAAIAVDAPLRLTPSAGAIWAALALAIPCTGIALMIYFRLIKTLGSLGTASQSYLRAAIGVLLGMVFLDETLTPLVAVGLVAAIAGVAAINAPVSRRLRHGPQTKPE